MSQPFIKFISHTTTYLVFICLIIVKTQRVDFRQPDRFSAKFPENTEAFANYVSNTSFKFRYYNDDFSFRTTKVSYIDYLCCFWIFGKSLVTKSCEKNLYLEIN